MGTIASIQIGLPKDVGDAASPDPMERPWRTAFFKQPVNGPVRVEAETIVGDGVADRVNHGGPNKAILGYAAAHYLTWRMELDIAAPPGAFGENLTIDGQTESDVCVGDVYQIGNAVLQVSQPRQPCWKLGRRWRLKEMPGLVVENGRSGWYFRVLSTGEIGSGQAIQLLERSYERLSIAVLNDMMYGRRPVTADAAECPALANGLRKLLRKLVP